MDFSFSIKFQGKLIVVEKISNRLIFIWEFIRYSSIKYVNLVSLIGIRNIPVKKEHVEYLKNEGAHIRSSSV